MLVWLAGARLHAGQSVVPYAGADAAWLVAFAHPPHVAASTESRPLLLFCALQRAGSLTLALCALACVLAQRPSASTPCPAPSCEGCRFTLPVQLGPRFLFAFFCLPVTGDR